MKSIHDLFTQASQDNVIGAYRVKDPRRTHDKKGQGYLVMALEDATGSIQAYSTLKPGLHKDLFVDNKRMLCTVNTLDHKGKRVAIINRAVNWVSGTSSPTALIPISQCPCPDALTQLNTFRNNLESSHLKNFMERVLADDSLAYSFVSSPASLNHHHNHPGGLLVHSLEVVEIVKRLGAEQQDLLEMGLVAALFHDIGKIRTLSAQMKRTQLGYVVDHDALTLEILGPALSQLERRWADGATALRYLWTWQKQNKCGTPLMVMAEALRSADRISSGQDVQQRAFDKVPPWQQGAKLDTLPMPQRFWRPRHPVQTEVRP